MEKAARPTAAVLLLLLFSLYPFFHLMISGMTEFENG
jgi:hypothetical protein